MNLKNLERRTDEIRKKAEPTAVLHYQDGNTETVKWFVALHKCLDDNSGIVAADESCGGTILNAILYSSKQCNEGEL